MEIHHRDGQRTNNRYANLTVVHGHCHDRLHGSRVHDKNQAVEERSASKEARSVLEQR
jgi:RNA-directed DNA polymerase